MTDDLAAVLGQAPPDAVAALPADDRAALCAVIDRARAQQSAALAASFDLTLKHLPFPLRAVVKRVLL